MTPIGKQIRVALGTVEVTDTDRRAIAWYKAGRPAFAGPDGSVTWWSGCLADRAACKAFLLWKGEDGLEDAVSAFFEAGGMNAYAEALEAKAGAAA